MDAGRYGDDAARAERGLGNCLNSFSADTPVATADGEKPISAITVGGAVQRVLAYDEASRSTGLYTVTDTISHVDQEVVNLTLDHEQLETTPEHPFYAMLRGWVAAGELHVGDHVRRADGSYGPVQAVEVEARTQWI